MKKIEVKIIKKWKEGDAQEVEEKQVDSKYIFRIYAQSALSNFKNCKKINNKKTKTFRLIFYKSLKMFVKIKIK